MNDAQISKKSKNYFYGFLNEYLAWVSIGAPEDNLFEFVDFAGLCRNMETYLHIKCSHLDYLEEAKICLETGAYMSYLFARDGLDTTYPFESQHEYLAGDYKSQNPKRIAWVRETLNKLNGKISERRPF